MKQSIWEPLYKISSKIARALMDIEAAKAVVVNTPLSPAIEAELRHKARVRSSHYSTRIEGNRLNLKEAGVVIKKKESPFSWPRTRCQRGAQLLGCIVEGRRLGCQKNGFNRRFD